MEFHRKFPIEAASDRLVKQIDQDRSTSATVTQIKPANSPEKKREWH